MTKMSRRKCYTDEDLKENFNAMNLKISGVLYKKLLKISNQKGFEVKFYTRMLLCKLLKIPVKYS